MTVLENVMVAAHTRIKGKCNLDAQFHLQNAVRQQKEEAETTGKKSDWSSPKSYLNWTVMPYQLAEPIFLMASRDAWRSQERLWRQMIRSCCCLDEPAAGMNAGRDGRTRRSRSVMLRAKFRATRFF